ncbi:MAG TPA: D-alanine--D-alanine ligase [Verrucomicrobiae bacterium]|nr:D-alanine--D-alanine ligase [Verrucomicrobiae bacterium]
MIAVLTGGDFSEREASLATCTVVTQTLESLNRPYTVIDLKEKDWQAQLSAIQPEVAFIAMHGTFAEDGQLQRILEGKGVSYTGSSAAVSELAFDKHRTKEVVAQLGIAVPRQFCREEALGNLPVVLKPNADGSSVGVSVVRSAEAFPEVPDNYLIEEMITGREFSVAVIDDGGAARALPAIEITYPGEFFDYQAKYESGGAVEVCPADIPQELEGALGQLSVQVYKALGVSQYARIDWIVRDGRPYFLEINTVPGMTPTSLINKELEAAGIPFEGFISDLLLHAADPKKDLAIQ